MHAAFHFENSMYTKGKHNALLTQHARVHSRHLVPFSLQ